MNGAKYKDLITEREELLAENAYLRTEGDRLKVEATEAQGQLEATRKILAMSEAEINRLKAQNAQLVEQVATSIGNTNEAQRRWLETGAQLADAQKRIRDLEQQLALAKEAAHKTQEYNEEIIGNIRAKLAEAQARIKELEKESDTIYAVDLKALIREGDSIRMPATATERKPEQERPDPERVDDGTRPENPYAPCEELLTERDALLREREGWKIVEQVFDITYDRNRTLRRQLADTEHAFGLVQEKNVQLSRELEYHQPLHRMALRGWRRSQEENDNLRRQLAATEEALAQVQQESADLRAERDEALAELDSALQELRKAFPLTAPLPGLGYLLTAKALAAVAVEQIKMLKAERDEARQDRTRLLEERADLRQEHDGQKRLNQQLMDVNGKSYDHLKRALPDLTATTTLTGIAHAAADRIAVLQKELDENARWKERLADTNEELHDKLDETEAQLAKARADRDREQQDRIALQQEQNAAMHALMQAIPKRVTSLTDLAGEARDQIERLTHAVRSAQVDFRRLDNVASDRIHQAHAENHVLREALKEIEWQGAIDECMGLVGRCPECARLEQQGHGDDCKLARAISGEGCQDLLRKLDDLQQRDQDSTRRIEELSRELHKADLRAQGAEAKLAEADQRPNNSDIVYTILREAFSQSSQITSLIGLARAAVTKIEDIECVKRLALKGWERLQEWTTRPERKKEIIGGDLVEITIAYAEKLETRLADERGHADRASKEAGQQKTECERLRLELKAARQVCVVVDAWEKVITALANHHTLDLARAGLGMQAAVGQAAMRSAIRQYREHANNQQPQGEQPMPTIQEVADQMAQAAPSNLTALGEQEKAQTALEAEMKRRLEDIMAEGREAPVLEPAAVEVALTNEWPQPGSATVTVVEDAPTDQAEKGLGDLRDDAKTLAEKMRELSEPSTTSPPRAEWPITPETAPEGARILVRQGEGFLRTLYEVTIHEWAPSGERVLVYDRAGRLRWSEDLPKEGVLVETLPKEEPHPLARLLAKRMIGQLMGDGARQPDHIYNLAAAGRNKVELLDHAIQQLAEMKRRAQEQEPAGATKEPALDRGATADTEC